MEGLLLEKKMNSQTLTFHHLSAAWGSTFVISSTSLSVDACFPLLDPNPGSAAAVRNRSNAGRMACVPLLTLTIPNEDAMELKVWL